MVNLAAYLRFSRGTSPLIISVPHGGSLDCEEIPKRLLGILGIDKATISLAELLILSIEKQSNYKPSYIFSLVKRSKIDINRPRKVAFIHGSSLAGEIYDLYHNTLKEYINQNIENFGRSLLIDIHGFEKHKRPPGYRDVELILGTKNLTCLIPSPVLKKDAHMNLRGAIIKRFNDLNIPIAPGTPRRKEYVLTGGYITEEYGYSAIPRSQAIQIEFSDKIRLIDIELKEIVIKELADLFVESTSSH